MTVNIQENKTDFSNLVKNHPCFDSEAHIKCGRIHLPVSPVCNIQCKFCKRCFNRFENRPGVSSTILTPAKALRVVDRAVELCPELTVVGIAGPGDTLATDHAIKTFELVHEKYPDMINCLSTNGLLLKYKAERIAGAGVKTVTVTVNAVDADVLVKICSGIVLFGNQISGKAAALQLIISQLAGIKEITRLGVVVKVNTVLIPGVNDHNIGDIARVTRGAGASLINIIPLIPQGEMSDITSPSCAELNSARDQAEKHLPVFRHCKHCRADACGVPGLDNDLSDVLYELHCDDTFSHG
ncbi:MAG: radical SAM protein [Bacillota bacterium]|nr:radical SAM protein [Bacillota bacterium]